jgi:TonB family protein
MAVAASASRFALGAPIALSIAIGLGLTMQTLVSQKVNATAPREQPAASSSLGDMTSAQTLKAERREAGVASAAVEPARRIFTPVAEYPAVASGSGEGRCLVRFDVDPAGHVRNPEAVRCTSSAFARAAERTALLSAYEPAMASGGPIATTGLTLEIAFTPEK